MSTTEQTQSSKDKTILKSISYRDFSLICTEHRIVEKSINRLIELSEDIDTPIKEKISIYKWLVEMNIGKPKQQTLIATTGDKPQVVFDILGNEIEIPSSEDKDSLVVNFITNRNKQTLEDKPQ